MSVSFIAHAAYSYLEDVSNTPLETSVQTCHFTWRNIPEDGNFMVTTVSRYTVYRIVFKELSRGSVARVKGVKRDISWSVIQHN